MADLTFRYNPGLTTLYLWLELGVQLVRASDGSLVSAISGNTASASIQMTESALPGLYYVNIPSGTAANVFVGYIAIAAGAGLTATEMRNPVGGPNLIDWDGAKIVTNSTVATAVGQNLAAIQNVQNNTFIASNIPQMLERPDAGSMTVQITVVVADETGTAKNIDASANPTVVLVNNSGTDLSSRLGSWSNPATGKYVANYTNTSTDAIDDLHWDITTTVNGKLRRYVALTQIVDTTAVDFTSSDRTALAAAAASASSADGKLTAPRLARIDGASQFDPATQNVKAVKPDLSEIAGTNQLDTAGESTDWTDEERKQIRYRLGIDGATDAPTHPDVPPSVITPPGDPALATAYIKLVLADGSPAVGETISYRLVAPPTGGGVGYSQRTQESDPSDDAGVIQFPVVRGSETQVRWQSGAWISIVVPTDADTIQLPTLTTGKTP